jgi:GNAT superfamily N-acetyltransferase
VKFRSAFFGALLQDSVLGVLQCGEHISLLFVKKEFQRKGIAKALFSAYLERSKSNRFTVNFSPYAKELSKVRFSLPRFSEQTTNGIRYIPMVFTSK